MSATEWILVGCFSVGGLAAGLLLSRLTYRALAKENRPDALQGAASPLSSLVLWACIIVGLIASLGVISPESLDQLPRDLVAFLPRVLSAAIIVIFANVVSSFALTALGPALARASAAVQRQVATAVRVGIVGLAVLLAVAQLGVESTVLNIGVAAIFFGLAASFTLLVGLGGRSVAGEVAATRTLRRLLSPGDRIVVGELAGLIVAMHPTAVEVEAANGERVLIPASQLTSQSISIERSQPTEP